MGGGSIKPLDIVNWNQQMMDEPRFPSGIFPTEFFEVIDEEPALSFLPVTGNERALFWEFPHPPPIVPTLGSLSLDISATASPVIVTKEGTL